MALGEAGGVYVSGSAILAIVGQHVTSKLHQRKFCPISGLQDKALKEVQCGDYHTTCLTEEGMLYTWGGALNTKMFRRPSRVDRTTQEVVRPLQNRQIKQVSCGDFHTVALEANGQVWTWGGGKDEQKNKGQCGHGTTAEVDAPKQMSFFENRAVVKVAAGGQHSLAACEDSAVYAWGAGHYGQTGLGEFVDTTTPRACLPYEPKTKTLSIASFSQV